MGVSAFPVPPRISEDSLDDVTLTPAHTEDSELCTLTTEARSPAWLDPATWQDRRYVWFGRIRALRVFGKVVYIGPHWYASLIMLFAIIGVGSLFLTQVASELGFLHKALGT